MGKTGTTLWAQVKGVKGQIRARPEEGRRGEDPGSQPALQGWCQCQANRPGRRSCGRTRWRTARRWQARWRGPLGWLRYERVHSKPHDPPPHEETEGLCTRCQGKVFPVNTRYFRGPHGLRGDPTSFFTTMIILQNPFRQG